MPPRTPSRKQPEPSRTGLWISLALILLIAIVAGAYFWTRGPAPAPTTPAATPAVPPPTPIAKKHIYSETADPAADIAAGLAEAKREHKRVLLDFGGDWCGDCQVLDIYFHQAPNQDLLEKHFVLVHVWIGQMDAHIDVAAKYGVPVNKGVPALAVLAPTGKVLYSQATGEFRDMRHMDSSSVTEFLEKWKS
jgi:thiol:disulfide interchange protein